VRVRVRVFRPLATWSSFKLYPYNWTERERLEIRVSVVSVQVEIRIGYLPNKSQKRYRSSDLTPSGAVAGFVISGV
jgi:hypothetical protein